MNSTGKKIVTKIAVVAAVSSSALALPAASAITLPISAVALAEPQGSPPGCKPPWRGHCYSKETIQNYMNDVRPMIMQFFRVKYKAMPEPSHYYFIPEHGSMPSRCQDKDNDRFGDNAYNYCPDDHNIYLGQMSMWQLYDKDGYIAPAVGMVHELGHHIQSTRKVPEQSKNHEENVKHENQADCIAGAWIQYADQQKWLKSEDFHDIAKYIRDIASAESPDRDHGDLDERAHAISKGMNGGLEACNDDYPASPIITDRD
ncbi:MAG: neutral zinc metallopeptidase [Pseudonocardiaceae bacterium]